MADAFIGEIRIFAFDFAPRNWAHCNGQVMAIAQNQALFSLLGTTYGGNGVQTFSLPDLRGRGPLHFGQLAGGSYYTQGEVAGTEQVTLSQGEMPPHTHFLNVTASPGTQASPQGALFAAHRGGHAAAPDSLLSFGAVASSGNNQPHGNMAPYLVLNYCMCIYGMFPSRN